LILPSKAAAAPYKLLFIRGYVSSRHATGLARAVLWLNPQFPGRFKPAGTFGRIRLKSTRQDCARLTVPKVKKMPAEIR
jgi:hypothetical protein